MSFLTGNAASATVAALEEGSVVLAVPRESVAGHLIADAGFAVRFYPRPTLTTSDRKAAPLKTQGRIEAEKGRVINPVALCGASLGYYFRL